MWIASLSNGETVSEYGPRRDETYSPWQGLIKWLKENEAVKITQLRLQKNGVTIVGIPKADGYVQCRQTQKSLYKQWEETYQGIGSVIGGFVYMTWLNDSGTVKQEVFPLSEMLVHSTLQ